MNCLSALRSTLLFATAIGPPKRPTIRNRRYPVAMILDLLSAGMTHEEILADYPALEEDDIRACLTYASRLAQVKSIHRVLE